MNKKNLTEEVFQLLQAQILNFNILSGVKISDKEIAEKLGVSRTPVREAIIRLSGKGLVECRHNRGFFVKVFTIEEAKELYTLRASLEEMAVGLATKHMTPNQADQLKSLVNDFPALMKDRDIVRLNESDNRFHELIGIASRHKLLAQTLKNLHGQIWLVRRYDFLRETANQETYEEHLRILGYILQRKTALAQKAITNHILRSMQNIIHIMERVAGSSFLDTISKIR